MFTGLCNETNVGVRDELKVIPNGQMTASTNTGDAILGRLHGTSAWCPAPADATPYLQIDLGQKYVICGVEAQGDPGASFTTSFSLSTSQDDASPTFTDYVPTTVISYSRIFVIYNFLSFFAFTLFLQSELTLTFIRYSCF